MPTHPPSSAVAPVAVIPSEALSALERSYSGYPEPSSEPALRLPVSGITTPSATSEESSSAIRGGIVRDGSISAIDTTTATSTGDMEFSPIPVTPSRSTVSKLFATAPVAEEDKETIVEPEYATLEGFEDAPEEADLARHKLKVFCSLLVFVYWFSLSVN